MKMRIDPSFTEAPRESYETMMVAGGQETTQNNAKCFAEELGGWWQSENLSGRPTAGRI